MTKEEINLSIAEFQGWTKIADSEHGVFKWYDPDKVFRGAYYEPEGPGVPNCFGDLNAMHEVEKTLTDKEYDLFEEKVYDYAIEMLPVVDFGNVKVSKGFIRAVSATAAQRAKAFLVVKKRWKD